MLYDFYKNGINLGGWLSQYDCLPAVPKTEQEMSRHLQTYITERDIAFIASLGMDHVRIPVDYRVLEKEPDSLTDEKTALHYIDTCVNWCEKYHLNVILDLHNAAGNIYGMMQKPMPLLAEEKYRSRFITIWERLAYHFRQKSTPIIMFELLNEVSDGSGYLWNSLYHQTISAIRSIDPDRFILVGSNEQNSPFCLKELNLSEDNKVFYNFHFYDPQAFTHQQAHFSEEMVLFNRKIPYPGNISDFTDFLRSHRNFIPKYHRVALEERVDQESMRKLLKDAFDFVTYSGHELYCGEFGVVDTADDKDAIRWLTDFVHLLDEYKIGHALWNYKEMDFGLVNVKNEIVSDLRLSGIRRFASAKK